MSGISWTDARIERLKSLYVDRLSASQIAAELGGVTRNAVIGKLHRMGLEGRPRAPRQSRPAPKPRGAFNARRASELEASAIETGPVIDLPPDTSPDACTLLELTPESCRWPMGDPSTAEFRYCGSQKLECGPYCARHRALAYGKPMAISEEERQRRVTQAQLNYRTRMRKAG